MDMDTLIQADIFFFVTTVALIVLTGLAAAVLIYFVSILRDVKHVSRKMREQADSIFSVISNFRNTVRKIFVSKKDRTKNK